MATQTRAPTSDEAATGTLTGSAGTRFTLVDDYPDTTGADVITFGTVTALITFGFTAFSIPAGSTSISVQVQYYDGEAANGANNCGGRVKVGGSYFNAATHNPAGTAYTAREDNFATNPKTAAAWTVDDINGVGANALQAFGIGSTDSNPTFRVSSVQLQVTYTEPSSSGTAATTSTAQTTSLTGTNVVDGSAASSATAQTTAASAAAPISGTIATAASSQTTSATGDVVAPTSDIDGTAATSASPQVTAATGGPVISGGISSSSAAQTTSLTGAVRVSGTSASSPTAQTSSAIAALSTSGTTATQASAQITSAVGDVEVTSDITGTIATVASSQSSAAAATLLSTGSIVTAAIAQVTAILATTADGLPPTRYDRVPRRRKHEVGGAMDRESFYGRARPRRKP